MDKKSYQLSAQDVLKIAPHGTSIIVYDQLRDVNNINEILNDNHPNVLLLYKTAEGTQETAGGIQPYVYGHWTDLHKWHEPDGQPAITFFNSYGGSKEGLPDGPLGVIPKAFKDKSGQSMHYLNKLLKNSDSDIHYLFQNHQKHQKGNATCGRHASFYLKACDLIGGDPEDYNKTLQEVKKLLGYSSTDDLITDFTNHLL